MMKLDVGCGNNKQEGCIGVDLVRLQSVNIIADIGRGFPFKDNIFDEIFCYQVLEHFHDPIKILEEIWRVAKPGAKVFISVPHCQFCGAFRDPTHKSFFHEDTMNHFTEYAHFPNWYSKIRFEVVEVKLTTANTIWSRLIVKIPKLPKILWNIYFHIHYKLLVEKYVSNEGYPRVTIIVLNCNGLKDTIECIESLDKLTYPNYEIILVDNGSTDGSQDVIIKRFPEVVFVQNSENLGFAAGLDLGIGYASGEYIAFLNNDTVVECRWLDELIKPFLTMNDKIGATNSTIMNYENREKVEYGGNSRMNIFGQTRASNRVEYGIKETHTISIASFMMKKEVIDSLEEFFCPEYFTYFEEIDLSWRLINRGYKLIYSPRSIVFQKDGMTSKKISDAMHVNKVRNKYLTFYRNLSKPRFCLIIPFLALFDIASILVLVFYSRRLSNAKLIFDGFIKFLAFKKRVKRYGNGRISFLEKRIF